LKYTIDWRFCFPSPQYHSHFPLPHPSPVFALATDWKCPLTHASFKAVKRRRHACSVSNRKEFSLKGDNGRNARSEDAENKRLILERDSQAERDEKTFCPDHLLSQCPFSDFCIWQF
jgi:hypothetical protein